VETTRDDAAASKRHQYRAATGTHLENGRQQMIFRFESEMAPSIRAWLERQGLLVKSEYPAPWGICDLVGVLLSKRRVRQRIALLQTHPLGPIARIRLLQLIPDAESGHGITVPRLIRELEGTLSSDRVLQELATLLKGRFTRISSSGTIQRMNGWAPLHRRIVAVELKLARPQEALSQAVSHLRFADDVYVALPSELAERTAGTARAELFIEAGVGILAVQRSTCKLVLRPKARRFHADPILQMHCVERFWTTSGISRLRALAGTKA